ncbi:MAG: class I adenylate-forming enzyme family protein [Candidatus Puniceispirillaceae bacterium]
MPDPRIDSLIAGRAVASPQRPAITFNGATLDYGGLETAVAAMAGWLHMTGIASGERIALYARNHPESFITLLAASRIGAILMPLNWRLSQAELSWQMQDAVPSLLLYGDDFADTARRIAAQAGCRAMAIGDELATARAACSMPAENGAGGADAELMLVYTSGTTGRPKGAVLSQAAMRANAEMSHHAYAMTPEDVVLNILPLFHVGGLNIQPLPALLLGGHVVIHDGFDPAAVLAAISDRRITQITVVPTILGALLAHPSWQDADMSSLRMMAIGSTDVPVALIEAVHERGIAVVQIYGATETAPTAIYQTADIAFGTAGSIGRAGCACEIRIVGADGQDMPTGEVGEIWVRGDNILTRYWNNEAASAASITDGWFHTGDMARVDSDGLYWFADRLKHVIISGGENIYPAELERVLSDFDGLAEFAIVGRDDPRWGQVPVVVAVRAAEAPSAEDVLAHFSGRIASFKRPKDVVFVESLPRNALGKIVAAEVRALL